MQLKDMLALGVLTGSRYFGTHSKESDWDIIVMDDVDIPILDNEEVIEGYGGDHLLGNSENIKGTLNGEKYNFICFDDKEAHDTMIKASRVVKGLGADYTSNKQVRHRVFEAVIHTLGLK